MSDAIRKDAIYFSSSSRLVKQVGLRVGKLFCCLGVRVETEDELMTYSRKAEIWANRPSPSV